MKKLIAPLLLALTVMTACKQSKKDMITGKWQAVKYENPEMDAFFEETGHYIDTLGSNGNAATNIELYGSNNIDSVRKAMREKRDSVMLMQNASVKNTTFEFTKPDLVVINFNGRIDSGKWTFKKEDGSQLEMEELNGPDKGTKIQIDVLTLKTDSLKLKIDQENTSSMVTFRRVKN